MIILSIFDKIRICKKLLNYTLWRTFIPILILIRDIFIIVMQLWPLMLTCRNLLLDRNFCITYRQWGPLLINDRHLLNIRYLMNIRNLLHTRKSLVVEWICFLLRVILFPLNLIITLGVMTLIFFSLYDFFLFSCTYPLP